MNCKYWLVCLIVLPQILFAQEARISVSGRAFDRDNPSLRLPDLMVINLATSQGFFGLADGTFLISVSPADTVMVASTGYEFQKFCFRDSVGKTSFQISVPLQRLKVNLREVTIFSPRELNSIYKDIEKLGYNKKDFQLSGINVLESPITFLYQEFSQKEQLKRHNAERINDDKRRQLLKDLLVNYVSYDIIQLDSYEFDSFIDFCQVPEYYLKTASQYDFCLYIKQKFMVYQSLKPRK